MVMAKSQWLNSATKLNPSVSQDDLGKIYDDHVNNPTVVNKGAPITPMDAKFNPDGMPLASHGQKTSYYDRNVSPNTAINHITTTNQSIGENKKNAWMTHAAAINPNTNQQTLSRIYDDHVSSPDRQNVDQQEQLAAIQKWNDHLYRNNKPTPETDPDEGKAGFDTSDKMSMIGSSAIGLGTGLWQGFIGIGNLALKLSEDYGAIDKGTVASFKEKEDRYFSQDKLYKEAHASHPIVNTVTNFIGSIAPMFAPGAAEGILPARIAARVATMADSIKALPGVAQSIKAGTEAMDKMGDSAVLNGAQKFMTKVLPLIRHGSEGALYGAVSYDPQADTEMKNATAGAIAALSLGVGGKVIKGMYTKLTPEIVKMQERYGITLPVMPKFNAFLSSMPLLGNGVKVAATQKEYIDNLGRQMANKISPLQEREASSRSQYGKFLHGELATGFDANKETASAMYQKVSDESMKLESISEAEEQKLPEITPIKFKSHEITDEPTKPVQSTMPIRDENRVNLLAEDMKKSGWIGQPVLGIATGDSIRAITGSHNLAAAKTAGINPKLYVIPQKIPKYAGVDEQKISDLFSKAKTGTDQEKLQALGKLNELRAVPKKAVDLMENEIKTKKSEYVPQATLARKFVDMTSTKQTASYLLADEKIKALSLQNNKLISTLKDFKDVQNMSYKDIQANRSAIGEEQGASVGREAGAYKMLHKSMSKAMDEYAEDNGSEIKMLHDKANKFYKEKVVPFLYGKWKKFLAPDYDTDDFLKDFLKPEHPGRIQDILGKLPEKEASLTASRAAIVHSALDDAELPMGGFNPEKFVKNLTKLGETNDVVFTPEQQGIIDGYGKLLQLTRKLAPKWLNDMPAKETSHMLRYGHISHGGSLVGLGYLIHSYPHLAIPAIACATGFIRLFTSTAGRKLLLNVSKLSGKISDSELSDHVSKAARIAISSVAPTATAGL